MIYNLPKSYTSDEINKKGFIELITDDQFI